jgi:hypothetical protein
VSTQSHYPQQDARLSRALGIPLTPKAAATSRAPIPSGETLAHQAQDRQRLRRASREKQRLRAQYGIRARPS